MTAHSCCGGGPVGLRAAIEGEVAVRDTQALVKAAATSRVLNMKKLEDAEDACAQAQETAEASVV